MRRMNTANLRDQSQEALERELEQARTRLKQLRFKLSSNQLKHVREIREIKRTMARIRTLLAQRGKQTAKTI